MRSYSAAVFVVLACAKPATPELEVEAPDARPPAPTPDVSEVDQPAPDEADELASEAPEPEAPEPEPELTTPVEQNRVTIKGGRFAGKRIATFELDVTEVTVEAYARCVAAHVCDPADDNRDWNWKIPGRERYPMNGVTAVMAQTYCEWVGGRLPDDLEWEWAARGREEARPFPWGDEPPSCTLAVMKGCGGHAEVGSRPEGRSRDGVLDLAGSVGEWVINASGGQTEVWALVIGGSSGDPAERLGASNRTRSLPPAWAFGGGIGFRCAADPPK